MFACTQLITSVTLLILWVIARIDHLLDAETPLEHLRYTTARLIVIPIGTLIAIGVAFYNVWLAEGIFLFFYFLGWFLRGIFYRRHHRVEYQEGTIRMCSITDNMTATVCIYEATLSGILEVERTSSKLMVKCIARRSTARMDGQLTEDRMDMHIDGVWAYNKAFCDLFVTQSRREET